ncbi:MAG: hypothetical protein R3E90_09010 [Marinicella sp.]
MFKLMTMLTVFVVSQASAEIEWPINIEPNPLTDNGFGNGVANLDEWLVIGDTQNDDQASNAGAIHVYQNVNGQWLPYQTLYADDAESNDQLGSAVAIERNHLTGEVWIMGSALNDDDSGPDQGAVYAFERDVNGDFIQQDKFVGTSSSNNFGVSIALNYDYVEDIDAYLWVLVVGDDTMRRPDPIGGGTHTTGGMTIYKKSGGLPWEEEPVQSGAAFFQALDSFDKWGASVSVDGIFIAAGAPGYDIHDVNNPQIDVGAVFYAFRDNLTQTWSCCSIILADQPQAGANLGAAVEIIKQPGSNFSIFAGAPLEKPDMSNRQVGAVHVWQNTGYVEKLLPSVIVGGQGEHFGSTIAANGDDYFGTTELLVGAPFSNDRKGRVYLFSKNLNYNGNNGLYLEKQQIVGSDTNSYPWDFGQFGTLVSTDGRNHVATSASNYIGSHRRVTTKEYPIFVNGFETAFQQ